MKNKIQAEDYYDPLTGEWNDSLRGDFLWSNVNVSEAVPDVMTPSTWSLWQIFHYEATPIRIPGGYLVCGNICGRPYLNLSVLASLYKAIGRDYRRELLADMVGSVPEDLDIPLLRFSAFSVLHTTLPGMIKAEQFAQRDQGKITGFLAETPEWCRRKLEQIQCIDERAALASLWSQELRPYFLQACWLLRSVTMLFSDPAVRLRRELSKLAGDMEAQIIMSNLSGSQIELESMGPVVALAQVASGQMRRENYLQRYGHRSPHEMELSMPGPEEDADWLDRQLMERQLSFRQVDTLLSAHRDEVEAAWERFASQHANKARQLRSKLDRLAVAARNREAVRSEMTRVTRLIRQFLLRVGAVTGLGDGVFFLSLNEMIEVLRGDGQVAANVNARRRTYLKYCSLPTYPPIIIGKFSAVEWAADPSRRSDIFDSRQLVMPRTGTIKGFAGAAGCIEGIVRRIDRPEDGIQVLPGEILVTMTTNVGWTPLFPRLAGIVTDVGAPLSHAAIVAREMGIPAVVGCGNATMLLKTGDHVRVDGSRGMVEILF